MLWFSSEALIGDTQSFIFRMFFSIVMMSFGFVDFGVSMASISVYSYWLYVVLIREGRMIPETTER